MSSGVDYVDLRQGHYHDSVTLLQVSQVVTGIDGVSHCVVAMATPLNVELARDLGFSIPRAAIPAALLVAIRGRDQGAIDAALDALTAALVTRRPAHPAEDGIADSTDPPPVTVGAALLDSPATLALISVPGPFAALEAFDAVHAGRSVMIFSDGISVADEVALKTEATTYGVLVMGPDCGTAIVNGIGLGFANAVRRGRVGIVSASGTGAQQVSSLLESAGVGVSQLLGVGGRDLSAEVGGLSAELGLTALDRDPDTDLIVLVSKPPDPNVARRLEQMAESLTTPVQFALIGADSPDLTAATESVLRSLGVAVECWPVVGTPQEPGRPALLTGYFVGGTLAAEARVLAAPLSPLDSNLSGAELGTAGWLWELPRRAASRHVVIDFGADDLTAGRAHPMIDPTVRLDQISRLADHGGGGRVLLLDVVLGYGAEPDPAQALSPVLGDAVRSFADRGDDLRVVVSLCGTEADPQGWQRQADALAAVGALVFASNAQAARHAVRLSLGAAPDRSSR